MQFGQIIPQSKFTARHDDVTRYIEGQVNGSIPRVLRGPQLEALQGLKNHFADSSKPNIALIVMPTGTGKSGVAALAPYVLNSTRVLIITPSALISTQLYADMCVDVGSTQTFYERRKMCTSEEVYALAENGRLVNSALGSDSKNVARDFLRYNLVIANAHKFGEAAGFNFKEFPTTLFDTVIVDEAHHYPAKTWKSIIDHFSGSKRVFITATPKHKNHNIVGKNVDDQTQNYIAYELSRPEAVAKKIIRPLTFKSVGQADDCEEARAASVIGEMFAVLKQHDDIDPTVLHQGMILCSLIDEVELVVRINDENFRAGEAVPYHGNSGKDGFNRFCRNDGQAAPLLPPRILVTCGKATEGFDHPQISAVGILRNVSRQSVVLFSQFVGRCVRMTSADDTVTATVISHVYHQQRANYDALDDMAEVDPEDEADF